MPVTPAKQERIDLCKKTARHQKADRVMLVANHFPYIVFDTGQKISVAARDYDLRLKMLQEFQERYNYDMYHDLWTRNPLLISDALGSGLYTVDDERGVNCEDFSFMEASDYPLFRDDYKKFLWTVIMKNKFYKLNDANYMDRMHKAMKAYDDYLEFNAKAIKMMDEKYGTLNILPLAFLTSTFDHLVNNMRGLRATGIDIRKHKDMLKQVTDTHLIYGLKDFAAANGKGSRPDEGIDIYFPMLGQAILSAKQFEEFVWPSLQQLYKYAEEYDKIIYIFAEAENSRLYEFFQEAPKGHFIYHAELDDPIEASKKLGKNMCVVGTVPTDILGPGTAEETRRYTQNMMEQMAPNGPFMVSENKMMSSLVDAKRENLIAMSETVHNFKL